jgi:hypothetical protein
MSTGVVSYRWNVYSARKWTPIADSARKPVNNNQPVLVSTTLRSRTTL